MARKLTFPLINRTGWWLAFKSALAGLLLYFVGSSGFSFWPLLLYIIGTLWIYFGTLPERGTLRLSFLSMVVLGLISVNYHNFPASTIIFSICYGVLFFVFLGIVSFFY